MMLARGALRAREAQRGGFVLGMIVGLLVGLAIALGVALYIAKVPVPFMDKVGHRTPEQDAEEAEKLKTWDPNAGLGGKPAPRPVMQAPSAASGAAPSEVPVAPHARDGEPPAVALQPARPAASAAAPAPLPAPKASVVPHSAPASASGSTGSRSSRDPAAILSGQAQGSGGDVAGAAENYVYFIQAGAYSNADDAEQQRARLAMQGMSAKVSEREQSGRTVYRVRLGPFDSRDEAVHQQDRLKAAGAESAIVRVERNKP